MTYYSFYKNNDPRQYYSPPSSNSTPELQMILDSPLLNEMIGEHKDTHLADLLDLRSKNLKRPCEERRFPREDWTNDEDLTFQMLLEYFYEALDKSAPGNTKTIDVVVGLLAPGFYFPAFLALKEYLFKQYGLAIRDDSYGDGVLKVRVFLGNNSYLYGAIGNELNVGEDHMYRNRIERPSLVF